MAKKKVYTGVGITPGELYGKIRVPREEFVAEEKLVKEKVHPYVKLCRDLRKRFPSLGKGAKPFKKPFKEALDFLTWDLKPAEFNAAVKVVLLGTLGVFFLIGLVVYFLLGELITQFMTGNDLGTVLYVFAPAVIAAFGITYYFQNYPIGQADAEKVRALTYVPEIVGYLTMSMKLVPNLEKAVEFAATHGKGKIAVDLKRLVWDVQLGVFGTLSEGLDNLAYRWGKYSEEFKEALMRVRASVLEATEAKRYALLDKTMEEVLISIREKMEKYARALSQPSIVLFYVGILLPLILIIILPIGSSFTGQPLARVDVLFLLYNLLLPGATFGFSYFVIKKRPPTYKPPVIPDNHPKLFGKYKMKLGRNIVDVRMMMGVVAVAGILISVFVSMQGIPPTFIVGDDQTLQLIVPDPSVEKVLATSGYPLNYFDEYGTLYGRLTARGIDPETAAELVAQEKTNFYFQPENDVSPFNLVFGLIITLSLVLAVFFYFTSIYKRKIQDSYVQMESEFKDSIYVLASRLGENKPVEEALKHTRNFLPDYLISEEVFGKTVDNIALMGLPLEQAMFDPVYGSLKDNPSTIILGSMRLLVDSVKLGVNVAARTLMSLSMQITNSEKVTKMLSVLVGDITGMMRTMAIFVAPIVLGVTTSLQKVVMVTLSSIAGGPISPMGGTSATLDMSAAGSLGGIGAGMATTMQGFTQSTSALALDKAVLASLASPTEFLLIVALYVVELVIVMVYFTTKIEEDNMLKVKMTLAYALPVAVIIFLATLLMANNVIAAFF
jgi:hypothetical protein